MTLLDFFRTPSPSRVQSVGPLFKDEDYGVYLVRRGTNLMTSFFACD